MSSLQRRRGSEMATPFGRLDRMFDEWFRTLPMRQFGMGADVPGEELIRVDEYRDGNTQVIKADLPGIDPDKDVELTVSDGMLRINPLTGRIRATDWGRSITCAASTRWAPPLKGGSPPSIS